MGGNGGGGGEREKEKEERDARGLIRAIVGLLVARGKKPAFAAPQNFSTFRNVSTQGCLKTKS